MSRPFLLTGGLLAVFIGLGAADALLVEPSPLTANGPATLPPVVASSSSSNIDSSEGARRSTPLRSSGATEGQVGASLPSSSSFSQAGTPASSETSTTSQASLTSTTSSTSPTPPPPPAGAVKKFAGKDVLQTVAQAGFTIQETDERSLLSAVVQNPDDVRTHVLLLDGDRAGLVAWIETKDVKQVFLVLKESLHSLFSPAVQDLLDETQTPPGRPPRNFLTFLDPGISEERLVFVRVRERLFEFHIAPGREDAMYQLVETLTE